MPVILLPSIDNLAANVSLVKLWRAILYKLVQKNIDFLPAPCLQQKNRGKRIVAVPGLNSCKSRA